MRPPSRCCDLVSARGISCTGGALGAAFLCDCVVRHDASSSVQSGGLMIEQTVIQLAAAEKGTDPALLAGMVAR